MMNPNNDTISISLEWTTNPNTMKQLTKRQLLPCGAVNFPSADTATPSPLAKRLFTISGVMGAYILLYPRARILTLVFVFLLPIPAVVVLGEWFLVQFLAGINTLGGGSSGGVAVMAHLGGFILGMLITAIVRWR